MLIQLLDGIVDLARKSKDVVEHKLPGNRTLLVLPNGESREVEGDRQTHSDDLASFASLQDWAAEFAATDLVFKVSDRSIRAFSNRDNLHDSDMACLNLQHSAAFDDLLDWAKTPRGVKALVRGLRTKLAETCDPSYLSIFRRLDFSRKGDSSRGASHASESLGRSVEMAAQSSAGEIPENVMFTVRLFNNVPIDSYDLRFAVDVSVESECVAITEVGDCINEAKRQTREDLVGRLKAEFSESLVIESV